MTTPGYRGDRRALAGLRGVVRVSAAVLIAVAALLALSNCRRAAAPAQEDTPQAAFARIQKAAADGDIESYYNMCDEKGQYGLSELAFQLITMEIYDREPNRAKDIAGIQRAFREVLGLSAERAEKCESDPKVRREVFLQIVKKSRGLVPDTLKEALAELPKHELLACEMESDKVARLRLKSATGEKTWYMVRQDGRWLIAGGMSPYKPGQ